MLAAERKNGEEGAAAAAAAASPANPLFQRRIEFHPATKPYSPISAAGGNFRLETLNPTPSSGAQKGAPSSAVVGAPSSGKRSEGGEFFEHGLDPELSFRITFRRIGAGLQNLGNTCFLNSVLQCLTYTEPFAAYLQSGKHKSSCRTAGFCAMCALQNHVMIALQSTGKILSPFHLVKNLRCISRNFRNSRQEDAHEYMVNLLESMHKCCLPSGVPSESPSAYEKSLVHKIFGGRLRSQVKCTQCSYCSNKFDPFLDLSLEIVKADSLSKALRHFTAVEQLDGGEKQYQCQRCKEKVRAYKQLTIHKAPYVLTIHLKRFGPDIYGQKIDRKVDFGPTLDLKPFVSDPHVADLKYTLYGVLVHAGWSTHSGHYYCFVRTSSGMWHSLDDNQVLQVSEKHVLAQKAYMLFYVRDRSSTNKRSVDASRKDNIFANVHENQVIPQSASITNGAIQRNVIGGKGTECSSAKSKTNDSSHIPYVPVLGTPEHPLRKEVSTLQKNENTSLKEVLLLQDNGHVALREASLQTNGDALCKGSPQTAILQDLKNLPSSDDFLKKRPIAATSTCNQKLVDDFAQPGPLEEGRIATSCAKDALFTPESAQSSDRKSQLPNGCNGKIESGARVSEQVNCGFMNPTSENHTEKILEQPTKCGDSNTTREKAQTIDTPCTADRCGIPSKHGPTELNNQSSHMNGSIQKGAFGGELVKYQSTGCENDKRSNNLQCQSVDTNGSIRQEALMVSGTENLVANSYQAELKPKKIAKSLAKGLYFGGKHLFFKSLRPRKIKKHKRSKKCSKKMIEDNVLEDLNINDQGASTSEPAKVESDYMHSSKKRFHFRSNKKKNIGKAKDARFCNSDSTDKNDRDIERTVKSDVILSTSEQPKRSFSSSGNQSEARESDTTGKGPVQNGSVSLLMRGLKETTVARWDGIELPSSQIHGLRDDRNGTIGYVPDEWDEEYDRGRRKKVKKSRHSFSGPNLFQETANIKVQQKMKMKVDRTGSGNQPLRI